MMKGELLPFIFVILAVGLILISYLFYNIFYGIRYEEEIFRIKKLDIIRNLIENFKNYLHLSLTYSSHQALREHACVGGVIEVRNNRIIIPWICNGPNPVPVELSKDCLEKYTKYYLNIYLEKFKTTLPLKLSTTPFENCMYNVKRNDVLGKRFDEGNFLVNASKTEISVSEEKEGYRIYEKINISEFITKTRYWYMFRIFTEWANDDIFSPCVCSKIGCGCGSAYSEQECVSICDAEVGDCAQRALQDLQRRFDEHVKCEMRKICCAQGRGPSCLSPSPCLSWNNNLCSIPCEHKCYGPPAPQHICPSQPITLSTSTNLNLFNHFSRVLQFSTLNCKCLYWYEARLAGAYEFRCTDYKYFVPTSKGPVPLTFVVSAYAYWRDQDACKTENPCYCPEGTISCEECEPVNCCTRCFQA